MQKSNENKSWEINLMNFKEKENEKEKKRNSYVLSQKGEKQVS